jgi:hypothetical protein
MRDKLLAALGDRIGERRVYDYDGETWGIVFFDWLGLSGAFRDAFVAEIFGDCDDGDFAGLIAMNDGPVWREDSRWLPVGLDNVQDEDYELVAGVGYAEYPQFDRLLLVNLDEPAGDRIQIYSIDVDGTALPAASQQLYWEDLAPDRFRRP